MDLSNKQVLVIDNGLFPKMAIRLARDFGRVFYYTPQGGQFPDINQCKLGEGLPDIERVDSIFFDGWEDVDQFVFCDVGFGFEQEHLVALGKRVWGSRKGEDLELMRVQTKKLMKKLGLPVNPYKVIKGMEALREFIKENPGWFIKVDRYRGNFETFKAEDYDLVKSRLDEIQKSTGEWSTILPFVAESDLPDCVEVGTDGFTVDGQYPEKCLSGIEDKDAGYCGVFGNYADLPEPVTRFNTRMAETFKEYQYRGFFSTEVRVGKDLEPYMIDLTCFSDDTEVLTDRGWKLFKDLDHTESVATLNRDTSAIEYQRPESYVANRYDGNMVLITNEKKTIECLVTPDHNVWRTDRNGKRAFFEKASSLTDKGFIPRTGTWAGEEQEFFRLPEYKRTWHSGQGKGIDKTKFCPERNVPMDAWLRFLGIYLSAGCVGGPSGRSCVQIAQAKYRSEVGGILSSLPFAWTRTRHGMQISDVQLAANLLPYGLCYEKYVPEYVKKLSPRQIRIFLDAYLLGDGSVVDGKTRYFTTSQRIADDLQELVFKAGSVASISRQRVKGTPMSIHGGKTYYRNWDLLVVSERKSFDKFWFETKCRKDRYIKTHPYAGMVYCVNVPNHTLYVRRNGKPFWSGNCRLPSPPSELYLEMYTNISEIIWSGSEGKMVTPKSDFKFGCEIILKSAEAESNWQAVKFPPSSLKYLAFHNAVRINGIWQIPPQPIGVPEIGAAIGMADTFDEAVENAKEVADSVRAHGMCPASGSTDNIRKKIEELDKLGLNFFGKV